MAVSLITDRVQADVDRVKELKEKYLSGTITEEEKQEWDNGLKGAYNNTDMNRVGIAISDLKYRLDTEYEDLNSYRESLLIAHDSILNFPYDPDDIQVNPKTNYGMSDVPTTEQSDQYLSDVRIICGALPVAAPPIPDNLEFLDYVGANNIEKALELTDAALTEESNRLHALVENTAKSFMYSGEIFAGEI